MWGYQVSRSGACEGHKLCPLFSSLYKSLTVTVSHSVHFKLPKSFTHIINLLWIAFFIIYAFAEASGSQAIISPGVLSGGDVGACPSSDSLDSLRQTVKQEIATAFQNITNCPCGGSGQWTNIANFNFSDPNVACPSDFTLLTTPVRGCKQAPGQGPVCISAVFSSGGLSYSRVCVEE